ncbi:zinc metallopeptidase [Zongyangia hominis]|uniref:Zinc metallopeptidase n=1 Tax=Zongyangia hominis TaxID=2763677 RepID=A0A926I7B4_9FIRM|nr:zinc metallopeptidase [Zongyangia hominis]MBC8570914.1 zinc metallopeptidase [Zongyangia hominis]
MFYYYDLYYLILVVPALLLSVWAQLKVSTTFSRYERVLSRSGLTAAEAARRILDRNGLSHIQVQMIDGKLSDHFDPKAGVIRLSGSVYHSTSVAALGVAAHEAGHAVQYGTAYTPIKVRNSLVPVTNLCSTISIPLVILGFFMGARPLVIAGILLFSAVAVFQLVTLPVEFNASRRAIAVLGEGGMLDGEELQGAKRVLSAAAMTYVAALLVTLMQLLRLVLLAGRRNRD